MSLPVHAQLINPDPYPIIDSLSYKLDLIEDYSAEIEIEVDVDFISMPVKHATIYYKKPDKIKFKSDEFIMLPKKGLGNRINSILKEPFTAIYLGQEILGNEMHHIIRIVPMGKNPDIILATWWINSSSYLIAKNESNTKNEGSFTVDFIYDDPSIALPTEMIFFFNIEQLKLPLKFIGKSKGTEVDPSRLDQPAQGKVMIRFSKYQVNQRLQDDMFIDAPTDEDSD